MRWNQYYKKLWIKIFFISNKNSFQNLLTNLSVKYALTTGILIMLFVSLIKLYLTVTTFILLSIKFTGKFFWINIKCWRSDGGLPNLKHQKIIVSKKNLYSVLIALAVIRIMNMMEGLKREAVRLKGEA